MLKWSPQERGKDRDTTPMDCFSQLELILQLKVNSFMYYFTLSHFRLMWTSFCCFVEHYFSDITGLMLAELRERLQLCFCRQAVLVLMEFEGIVHIF